MFSVLSSIAVEHEYRFIGFAAIVCVVGSFLTMSLFSRIRSCAGSRRYLWLLLAGLVGGSTIWTTHFAAMLGYFVPFGRTFEPASTLLSLAVAIGSTSFSFFVASRSDNRLMIGFGGLLFGLGSAAMHYIGMSAYLVPGFIRWDTSFVVASVVVGGLFGAATTLVLAEYGKRTGLWGATAMMVLCIVTLHFTGMAAMTIVPLSGIDVPPQAVSDDVMLAAVVGMTMVIIVVVGSAFLIDQRSMEEAATTYRHLALHDPMTGMPNRSFLKKRIEEDLEVVGGGPNRLAVVSVDLDRFKDINDLHGQMAGDKLLQRISERLQAAVAEDEFIARNDGDEFVAVKRITDDDRQAMEFASRIRHQLDAPFHWNGDTISIASSTGISLAPRDGRDAHDLIARAGMAAYHAKMNGGDRVVLYETTMEKTSRIRASIAMDLKSAIANRELELYYQPQNDTRTRRLKGFEALVRWNHPKKGLIPPSDFIPVAEETGLILDIGAWVLETACRTAANWPGEFTVAVNVSARQLAQETLPHQVAGVLARTGLLPGRLEIELTESGLIADQEHALKIVQALKDLGVSVAMDDFGTGYSSLSTLQSFPFDKIKIDREFVRSLTSNQQATAIVKSTLLLGSSLNIPVLAEGVETEDQLSFLEAEGCQSVQGFLFGRPLRLEQCEELIREEMQGRLSIPLAFATKAGVR
ncbi:putative bifunctional diguanylate cyclase/phosphodiesterase [Roseibium sp.]|uniref:putative bifunctional diguanylate cyclase/phosphodiesterase n=1 Tax=Roseibium sp. TaxID=1936156 RepID=UPI003A97B4F1